VEAVHTRILSYAQVNESRGQVTLLSMVGLSGFFGSLGGVVFSAGTGMILERTGRYSPMFIMAGVAYLLALAIIHSVTCQKWQMKQI
jgi:nitrate/nitrite transporter NarK